MTLIHRIRVALTGFPGAPGVNTFYALDAPSFVDPLHTYFTALAPDLPSDVHWQIEPAGDILEDTTGALTGSWGPASTAAGVGTNTGLYAAPAGWVANWLTNTILDGKHVRGKTFHVPAAGAVYEPDGSLSNTGMGNLISSADALAFAGTDNFVVWHRPRVARPADGSRPAVTARAGGHAPVLAALVRDKVAVLRSRRD